MSLYPVYRTPAHGTVGAFPENLIRTMAPQMFQYRRIVGHHFARRNQGNREACKNWIAAFRRDLKACGWNASAAFVNAKETAQ